jgi:hypothetical protein
MAWHRTHGGWSGSRDKEDKANACVGGKKNKKIQVR